MTGEILLGPQRGQQLEQISTEELLDLLTTCYQLDPESAEALEVYLVRERGQRINEPPPRRRSESAPPPSNGPMNDTEARAILGIGANAGSEEIQTAHRRLIQRLHPDRGGSDYLAAKVNEAKRLLLS